jgi:NADH-quinone oxidoreductase subunit L
VLFRNSTRSTSKISIAQGLTGTAVMSHDSMQNLLLAIPLAPLAGSLIAGLFGTQSGAGRTSVTILGVLIAFVLSAMVFYDVMGGASFNAISMDDVGTLKMESASCRPLTAMMMMVV